MPFILTHVCEEDNAKFSFMITKTAWTCRLEAERPGVKEAAALSGCSCAGRIGMGSREGRDSALRRCLRRKDTQHRQSSGRCKSEPQGDATSLKVAAIKKTDSKCWQECRETGALVLCWWQLPYDPAIPLLSTFSEKLKYAQVATPELVHVSVAALIPVAKK